MPGTWHAGWGKSWKYPFIVTNQPRSLKKGKTWQYAGQENMTLPELKKVIADIYPGQIQFYVIEFKCL